jgi:hypothetical protein
MVCRLPVSVLDTDALVSLDFAFRAIFIVYTVFVATIAFTLPAE